MLLTEFAVFLAAAVVAVPIFKRLGLGLVLGYLAAGAAIGPSGLGLVHGVDEKLHLAEFGVVLQSVVRRLDEIRSERPDQHGFADTLGPIIPDVSGDLA